MIQFQTDRWVSKDVVNEIYIHESHIKFIIRDNEYSVKVDEEFEESFLTSFGIDSNKVQGIKKRQQPPLSIQESNKIKGET